MRHLFRKSLLDSEELSLESDKQLILLKAPEFLQNSTMTSRCVVKINTGDFQMSLSTKYFTDVQIALRENGNNVYVRLRNKINAFFNFDIYS